MWMLFVAAFFTWLSSMLLSEIDAVLPTSQGAGRDSVPTIVAQQAAAERICAAGCNVGIVPGVTNSAELGSVYDGSIVVSWVANGTADVSNAPPSAQAGLGRYNGTTGIAAGLAPIVTSSGVQIPAYSVPISTALGIPSGALVLVSHR